MKITHSAAMSLLSGLRSNDGHHFSCAPCVQRTVSDAQRLKIGKWVRENMLTTNLASLKAFVSEAEKGATEQMRSSPWGVVNITADKSKTISGMTETLQLEGRDFEWSLA